ncbi:MAG: arginine--tRNA ligase, partial [Bacteroidales bacterium]|nr:arginine--tRNA ligase [Bacteroidales bacterium]
MIDSILQSAVANALKKLYGIDAVSDSIVLQKTKKEFVGDFTIVVFPYVKQARKSPEAVANELGAAVKEAVPQIVDFNVIKGFLNFSVSDSYWLDFANQVADDDRYGIKIAKDDEAPVVIEFSSPNTNKPLHLGHIRNNLLGWSVSQLLAANGRNVKKVNLVNDRGIHICKSMLAWMRYGNGATPESTGIKGDHLVGDYYVKFNDIFKE